MLMTFGFAFTLFLLNAPASVRSSSLWLQWFAHVRQTLPTYYIFLVLNAALWLGLLQRDVSDFSHYLWLGQTLFAPAKTGFYGESWVIATYQWFCVLATFICSIFVAARIERERVITLCMIAFATLICLSALARIHVVTFNSYTWDEGLRKLSLYRLDAPALGGLLACLFAKQRNSVGLKLRRSVLFGTAGIVLIFSAALYAAYLGVTGQFLQAPTSIQIAAIGSMYFLLPAGGSGLVLYAYLCWPSTERAAIEIDAPTMFMAAQVLFLCHALLLRGVDFFRLHAATVVATEKLISLVLLWFVASVAVTYLVVSEAEKLHST
jgi:hypothetical protein